MDLAAKAALAGRWDEALGLLRDADSPQLAVLDGRDPRALIEPPAPARISDHAFVYVCENYMPSGFAEHFMGIARDHLAPALTNTPRGVRIDPMRTNRVFELSAGRYDVISAIMAHRYAKLIRVPLHRHEPPNVLSYEPGQTFAHHCDFVEPAAYPQEIADYGQRVTTAVTYLNDDFTGGETDFRDLGFKLCARPGDAILFSNVMPDGSPDRRTTHAGLPPISGRKWALSQWARENRPAPLPWLGIG